MSGQVDLLIADELEVSVGNRVSCGSTPSEVLAALLRASADSRPDAWAILGEFEGDRRRAEHWRRSHGMLLDLDWERPDLPKAEGAHTQIPQTVSGAVMDALGEYPISGFAYATKRGVRVGFVFDAPVEVADEYEAIAEGAADGVLAYLGRAGVPLWRDGMTGLRYDEASGKTAQAMRLPLPGMPTVLFGVDAPVAPATLRAPYVPRLDLDAALPAELAAAVREIAAWVQIAPEVVVTGILSTASAAIGNTRWVGARGRTIPLSLHYLTILPSGDGKSTVRGFLRGAAKQIESDIAKYRASATNRDQKYRDKLEEWKADRRSQTKRDKAGPKPTPPRLRPTGGPRTTFVLSEGTIEGVIDTLQDTPRGLLWATDEAHEVLGVLGRYGDGKGARSLDAARFRRLTESQPIEMHRSRSNQSSVRQVPVPWMAMDADVQPGVVQSLFGSEDRVSGLTARILVHAPPSSRGRRTYTEPPPEPSSEVLEVIRSRFEALWAIPLALEDGVPVPDELPLDAEADRLWASELERLEKQYGLVDETQAGAMGHARGRVLRLAGVLALLNDPGAESVCATDMERAISHIRYHLEHHALLHGAGDSQAEADRLEALRTRVQKIHDGAPKKGVGPREMQRRLGARYKGPDGRTRAVADLNALGWVVRRPEYSGSGRRPEPAWYPPGTRNPSAKSAKRHSADSADASRGENVHGADDAADLLRRASEVLIRSGRVELPPPGARVECPLCSSSDGFGVLPDDPTRWYCHSDKHQGGGCAVDLLLIERLGRKPSPFEAVAEAKSILGENSLHGSDPGERLRNRQNGHGDVSEGVTPGDLDGVLPWRSA